MSFALTNPERWLQGQRPNTPVGSIPSVDIYAQLDQTRLTHDFSKGFLSSVLDAPLSVFGLTDIDYPYFKMGVQIKNGVATASEGLSTVLDDGSLDDARNLARFSADRINEILQANGLYGQRGVNSPTFYVGGASGRSNKLGKGLFIGFYGNFNEGAEYTGADSLQSFVRNLDQFVTRDLPNTLADPSGFPHFADKPQVTTNSLLRGKRLTLPAVKLENYPAIRTSLGKVDNTSGIARIGAALALAAAGAGLTNAISGAAGAGGSAAGTAGASAAGNAIPALHATATTAVAGQTGGMIAGSAIPAGTAGAAAGATAGGLLDINALPAASTANMGRTLTAGQLMQPSRGLINSTMNFLKTHPNLVATGVNMAANALTPDQIDLMREEGNLVFNREDELRREREGNLNVGGLRLGVRPSNQRILYDSFGNPVYAGGVINRAWRGGT